MKKIKASLLGIVLILSCLFIPYTNAKAEGIKDWIICDESKIFESITLSEKIDTISVKNSVIINGEKNYLYPTFDNKDTALSNIKIEAKPVLTDLAIKCNLTELTDENWELYRNAVRTYNESEYLNQKKMLESFFDIYENDGDNESILSCLEMAKSIDEVSNELFYSLPYTSPFYIEMSEIRENQFTTYSVFNVDAAINYAKRYAVVPNFDDYDNFGGSDCTNFVSQIMENGGIEQNFDGWYHNIIRGNHVQSDTWINANKFARYWGFNYTTTSHYNFAKYLQAGDFIMLDMESDGHWDHAGFVVQSDNYLTNGFFDYYVAQHSGNYLAWASTSTNGWDDHNSGNDTFGVIRK